MNVGRDLSDLAPTLRRLAERVWDMLPLIRSHNYDPAFRGSYSVKMLLPARVRGLDREGMKIETHMVTAIK